MIPVSYIKFSSTSVMEYTSNSKQKYDYNKIDITVLNSLIKNLFTTKSSEFSSVFVIGQALRPYSKINNGDSGTAAAAFSAPD